ncbi:unnamed protein product [Tilletia controversa]|uniref:Uncharacterized protein n=3 Tax=Tilletia TaxID=13289 RepID=A0A8X7MXT3_9BASI|nr:hypothetical protein CF336_g5078 [Tilletia laevis]KAE8195124.1 hypothetical protein CF328_g4539 [Tilletia controversa]KAE8257260.1 hypothetical protein A4X03_0g4733 [Tilletia caries]KAE8201556.1 hypothetical protein CF335_g3712 [Tilletia laevis]KAE8252173.1 hypothetical protein A4X06_0g2378 [Tilletia controversa]
METDHLLSDSEGSRPPQRHRPAARRPNPAAGSSSFAAAANSNAQNRARSPLRLPAALVSPRALFAALPNPNGSSSSGLGLAGNNDDGSTASLFNSGPPAPIARPTSPGIAHPGQHPRRRGRGGDKHASSLQTLRNNALPGGNQRLLFFPGAVSSNAYPAGRNRARQTTQYGAGDADYSPSPSPPLSPGFGALAWANFGGASHGGAGGVAAGGLQDQGPRGRGFRAPGQHQHRVMSPDRTNRVDALTNPLLAASGGAEAHNGNGNQRISWTRTLFRPKPDQVERWLDSWLKRWTILAIIPALVVWIWCAMPFPHTDPDSVGTPWCDPKRHPGEVLPPWCRDQNNDSSLLGLESAAVADSRTSWADSVVSLPDSSELPHEVAQSKAGFSISTGSKQTIQLSQIVARLHTPSTYLASLVGWEMGTPSRMVTIAKKAASTHAADRLPKQVQHPDVPTTEPAPSPGPPPTSPPSKVDSNFLFFLLFYYGIYVAVALIYVTQLFSLYRLNWWPKALGARTSYTFFWVSTIIVGWAIHRWDPFGTEERHRKHRGEGDDIQWQRKTLWVLLAFVAMAMPAVVCLTGLRRSGRQAYRHSMTEMQKTFLERQLTMRIPSSYIRFLWFISSIALALMALLAGQGYASVYLSTLPHTSFEGTAYVTFWMITVNCMALASHWILEEKVRSRALVFVFKYYYFLVYFVFYRNLFARLRSFDQFALIQLLSSFWVCVWYPFSMSGICHRIVQYFNPEPKSWEEYVEAVGLAFYLRNLAQNTTMIAFLGWVSILHFGNNQQLYPFFAFADKSDPYNYQLTMLGSLAIWASELITSFVAREICKWAFHVDVTALGLDEMRAYPEIVPTCVWSTIHVLMDMLFFLIKLNFH